MSAYYPIPCHPLLTPVARALTEAGLLVEPIREVRHVWGHRARGALDTANHVEAGRRFDDGSINERHVLLVTVSLGIDADPSLTGLSGTLSTGELWHQEAATYRQMVLVVRAPDGLDFGPFQDLVTTVLRGQGSGARSAA